MNIKSNLVLVRLYVSCDVHPNVLITSLVLNNKLNNGPAITYPKINARNTLRPARPKNVGIVKMQIHLTCYNKNNNFYVYILSYINYSILYF